MQKLLLCASLLGIVVSVVGTRVEASSARLSENARAKSGLGYICNTPDCNQGLTCSYSPVTDRHIYTKGDGRTVCGYQSGVPNNCNLSSRTCMKRIIGTGPCDGAVGTWDPYSSISSCQ